MERFNGSLRDKLLNEEIFDTLDDARRKPALRRYDYNGKRCADRTFVVSP